MLPEQLRLDHLASPIGRILLVTDEQGLLRALDFAEHAPRMRRLLRLHYGTQPTASGPAPRAMRAALEAYFSGAINALGKVRWATAGTGFQREVWAALGEIPAGSTTNYGALAARLGRPAAARAVGAANGANPVGIVVPCHRVLGANGALTGYGGGVARKRWLLAHEAAG